MGGGGGWAAGASVPNSPLPSPHRPTGLYGMISGRKPKGLSNVTRLCTRWRGMCCVDPIGEPSCYRVHEQQSDSRDDQEGGGDDRRSDSVRPPRRRVHTTNTRHFLPLIETRAPIASAYLSTTRRSRYLIIDTFVRSILCVRSFNSVRSFVRFSLLRAAMFFSCIVCGNRWCMCYCRIFRAGSSIDGCIVCGNR